MFHRLKMLAVIVLLLQVTGCGSQKGDDPQAGGPATDPSAGIKVARIAVMSDGTVEVNSKVVAVDDLATHLDSLGEISEVWYHRENPTAAEPHPNAMRVIQTIADRRLPLAMYMDRDFKQRVNVGRK